MHMEINLKETINGYNIMEEIVAHYNKRYNSVIPSLERANLNYTFM